MSNIVAPTSSGNVVRTAGGFRARAGAVIVADCSYSMSYVDKTKPRIEHLAQVLAYLLQQVRLQGIVAFNTVPYELPMGGSIMLPEPDGGTAIHLALDHVARMQPLPRRAIVISDGEPNDDQLAIEAAKALGKLGVPIDAHYVGPDNVACMDFMRRLSEAGAPGGKWGKFDLADSARVAAEIRLAITDQRGAR